MNESRYSKLSTSEVAVSRVRPSPRSSKRCFSRIDEVGDAVGGEGLDDQLVRDHVVERSVDASLHVLPGHRDAVGPAGPAVEVVEADREAVGPVPLDEQLGSTWARKTFSRGASNSRMIVTIGTFSSTMISASLHAWFSFGLVGQVRQEGVEALVALPRPAAGTARSTGHEVEHLRFEVDGATLGLLRAAHQAGVLQHLQVLGDGLERHVVGRSQLVDRGVGQGRAGRPCRAGWGRPGPRTPGRTGPQLLLPPSGPPPLLFNRVVEQHRTTISAVVNQKVEDGQTLAGERHCR